MSQAEMKHHIQQNAEEAVEVLEGALRDGQWEGNEEIDFAFVAAAPSTGVRARKGHSLPQAQSKEAVPVAVANSYLAARTSTSKTPQKKAAGAGILKDFHPSTSLPFPAGNALFENTRMTTAASCHCSRQHH
jgi:hypothetical protein